MGYLRLGVGGISEEAVQRCYVFSLYVLRKGTGIDC